MLGGRGAVSSERPRRLITADALSGGSTFDLDVVVATGTQKPPHLIHQQAAMLGRRFARDQIASPCNLRCAQEAFQFVSCHAAHAIRLQLDGLCGQRHGLRCSEAAEQRSLHEAQQPAASGVVIGLSALADDCALGGRGSPREPVVAADAL